MAQMEESLKTGSKRALQVVRSKKAYMAAVLALAAVLIGACGLGIVWATGPQDVLIERAGSSGEEAGSGGGAGDVEDESDAEDGGAADDEPGEEPSTVVVDVSGAVVQPGVVELPEGARVNDAIEAAGGLAADADASTINRAEKLTDGVKVYVPRVGEEVPAVSGGAAGGADAGSAGTGATALVNINSAGIDELDTLPGVGPSTAQAILDDRTQNGPFASVEDIMRVSGIGEKKFEKLKDLICV